MSYVVVKTVKGRRYRYFQTSWREGGRVRTKSICLGPLDGAGRTSVRKRGNGGLAEFLKAQRLSPEDRVLATAARQAAEIDQYQREKFGETAAEHAQRERQEHLDKLYELYGLTPGPRDPVPVDKTTNTSAAEETTVSEAHARSIGDAANAGKAE